MLNLGIINIARISLLLTSTILFLWLEASGQTYTDTAIDQGISPGYFSPDNFGSGISFYDIDQDGWDDLTYTRASDSIHFYLNNGGDFERVQFNIPSQPKIKQALWVDYDNDGDSDLMVSNYFGKLHLYQNDGDNNFSDVSDLSGLPQSTGDYYGISFADYNKDGNLDLFVAKYHFLQDDLIQKNELYKNNGDGTFTNATLEAGLFEVEALTFQGGWFDYNSDGWPDLYEINDRVNFDNLLYHNNGDGTFTCVSEETNTRFPGNSPMTFTAGDYDNDGDFDLYMTNTGGNTLHTELLTNDGNGQFQESALELGAYSELFSWGALWVDHNNNGRQDLYLATSPINLSHPVYKDQFFVQAETGYFEPDTSVFDEMQVQRNYAVARGDINNDGFPDIATHSINPYPANLWLNSGGDSHYIKITPRGTVSNRMAIGSWLKVFTGNEEYTQYTMCGENYVSQNSQHHIFGLGDATLVDSVEIEYVSGHKDTYYNLAADSSYSFTEGETYSATVQPQGEHVICPDDSVTLDAGEHDYYTWNNGHTGRYLTTHETGEYWVSVENEYGVVAHSDTVFVSQVPLPFIEAEVGHPICFGDSTGSISLENLEGTPPAEVQWDNGMSGHLIDSLPAGEYNYTYTDTNGCVATGNVLLQQPMLLTVLVFSFPETTGDDGSISLVINGGEPPYTVLIDSTINQGTLIDALQAGSYTITIIDSNGCLFTQEVEVQSTVSLSEFGETTFGLYPNPVASGGTLIVKGKISAIRLIQLFDAKSAELLLIENTQKTLGNQMDIDLPNLETGTYYLKIILEDGGNVTYPVVVKSR